MPELILASTSRYRKELLSRLGLDFSCDRPETDESAQPGEAPADLAKRLAVEKARAVALRHPGALIIGSDQVASSKGERFGKPGTEERAIAQLKAMRGKNVIFDTAVALLDTRNGSVRVLNVATDVGFRPLSDDEIVRYVQLEQPLDCAGSAKSEALGISLLSHIRGDDPNALIGLPLIALCSLLREAGVTIP